MKVTKAQLKRIIKEEIKEELEQHERQSAKLLKYIDDHPTWSDHRLEQYQLIKGVLERFWSNLASSHKIEIRDLVRPSEVELAPPEEEEPAEATPEEEPLRIGRPSADPFGGSPAALRLRAQAQGNKR